MQDEYRDKSGAIAEAAALEEEGSWSPGLYEAWRDLEARYAAIIEAFDGVIYICSQDYEVKFMNRQAIERTGGYPVGQKCYKALHNLENVCPWCVNERVFRGEKVSWEMLSPKDNRWYHVVNTPIRHGDGTMSKMAMIQDITGRKEAEEALRKKEQFLRDILDNIQDGLTVLAPDFNIIQVNLTIEHFPFTKPIAGRKCYEVFHGRSDPCEVCPARQAFQTGQVTEKEFTNKLADGSIKFFELRAFPLVDDATGQVQQVIEFVQDVTKRKEAERSLTEQFRFLQHLIDTIPSPIFYKDVNGVYLGCNQNMADFLGRPKEEIIGKTVFDLYPQEQAEKYFQMDRELFQNPGTQVYEFMMEGADRNNRNFIFSKATFIDSSGKVAGLVGAMTDITERKQAEEELRESLRLNQLIFDSLPSIALLIRADWTIAVSNQTAALAGAVPGQPCYATLWGLDAACPWCKAREALQTGKPLQAEIKAAGKVWDSHWIPINSELFLHFVHDISELKEAEQERAKLREQLFQAQKMEAIGTLAGGIAHDFNNILSAIIGYGEMLDLFHSAECPQVKSDLQEILKAAFRAKDLVQQILTFSRKSKQARMSLNILPVIKESIKFLRASLPSTIVISQSLDPEVGPVLADPTQIHQVLMNLCTNAAHAMRERGGRWRSGSPRW